MSRHDDAIAECRSLIEVCEAAPPGPWEASDQEAGWTVDRISVDDNDHGEEIVDWLAGPIAVHIAAHDPTFMLAMHRANLATMERHAPCEDGCGYCLVCTRRWPCPDVVPLLDLYAPEPQP